MQSARYCRFLLLAAVLLGQTAVAQSTCKVPSADCVVVGKWDISLMFGYGERSNPVHGRSAIPLLVIPKISYYGERFFLENLEFGFTLYEGRSNTFNLIAAPGYDRVFFVRDDLQNVFVSRTAASGTVVSINEPDPLAAQDPGPGAEPVPIDVFPIHRRRTTYLAGPEWLFKFGNVMGQVDALYEVTGEHEGLEMRAAAAARIIQSDNSLVVSAGLTWKSAELVRYYYGVQGLYEPGSALNPFVKVGFTRDLSDRWTLSAFMHYELLGSAIADSPLITEDAVATVFAGLVFKVL